MSFESIKDSVNFQRARYTGSIKCPLLPHFDGNGSIEHFECLLNETTTYLEYGSGGSTILAARMGKRVYSVDSDRLFLKQVRETLQRHAPDQAVRVNLIYANIGFTREWGQPIFTSPTRNRLTKWRSYHERPWAMLKQHGLMPDLVLVDGRFRVACALQSLLRLAGNPEARIIVDDYVGRGWYTEIERFGELVAQVGRMAIFRPRPLPNDEIEQSINRYSADWR